MWMNKLFIFESGETFRVEIKLKNHLQSQTALLVRGIAVWARTQSSQVCLFCLGLYWSHHWSPWHPHVKAAEETALIGAGSGYILLPLETMSCHFLLQMDLCCLRTLAIFLLPPSRGYKKPHLSYQKCVSIICQHTDFQIGARKSKRHILVF